MRILAAIRRIPRGRVSTYGRIATLAGLPGRSRLVGRILKESPLADATPWHRVVNATGRISLRPGDGFERQRARLEAEGVEIGENGRLDLDRYLWDPAPLRKERAAKR